MMLFAIVFGLSMDYEVFLLSRIKEEYDAHGDNSLAVAHGLAKTARLITAAAAIMICVFASFVLSDLRVLKLVGFGSGLRGAHRRDPRPARPRAGDDGAARRPQLVAAEMARMAAPRQRGRGARLRRPHPAATRTGARARIVSGRSRLARSGLGGFVREPVKPAQGVWATDQSVTRQVPVGSSTGRFLVLTMNRTLVWRCWR